MCVLRTRLGFVNPRCCRIVFFAVFSGDKGLRGILCFCGNALRVRTHIGDQTLCAAEFTAEIHAFIQFLRNLHDLLRLEAELF